MANVMKILSAHYTLYIYMYFFYKFRIKTTPTHKVRAYNYSIVHYIDTNFLKNFFLTKRDSLKTYLLARNFDYHNDTLLYWPHQRLSHWWHQKVLPKVVTFSTWFLISSFWTTRIEWQIQTDCQSAKTNFIIENIMW